MNPDNLSVVWSVAMAVALTAGMFYMTWTHESAHASVCELFGHEVTEFEVTPIGGHTRCPGPGTEGFLIAQANVEAFGYQLSSAVVMIAAFVWLLGLLMIELKR